MTNHKLIFFFSLLVLLALSNSVMAAEVSWPNLPWLPNVNGNPNLAEFAVYLFGLLIYAGGFLSLISFTIGAITLFFAAEDPSKKNVAADRMKGAALGLALIMVAFIIITTINPKLAEPNNTPLEAVSGFFYYNQTKNPSRLPAILETPDTATRPVGYDNVIYCCDAACGSGMGQGPDLMLRLFTKAGLEEGNNPIWQNSSYAILHCGDTFAISAAKSFKAEIFKPGVYYCLNGCADENYCNGNGSFGYAASARQFDEPDIPKAYGGMQGIMIVNDDKDFYGTVLHMAEKGLEYGGPCTDFFYNTKLKSTKCWNIHSNTNFYRAANVFTWNSPVIAGNGVVFYSEPFGWTKGQSKSGVFKVSTQDLSRGRGNVDMFKTPTSAMAFDYKGATVPPNYDKICDTFEKCAGSIRLDGRYIVGVYNTNNNGNYCKTFKSNVENLKTQDFVVTQTGQNGGMPSASYVYIFPIK